MTLLIVSSQHCLKTILWRLLQRQMASYLWHFMTGLLFWLLSRSIWRAHALITTATRPVSPVKRSQSASFAGKARGSPKFCILAPKALRRASRREWVPNPCHWNGLGFCMLAPPAISFMCAHSDVGSSMAWGCCIAGLPHRLGVVSLQACFWRCRHSWKALNALPSSDGGCTCQPLLTCWLGYWRLQGCLCAVRSRMVHANVCHAEPHLACSSTSGRQAARPDNHSRPQKICGIHNAETDNCGGCS